MKTTPLSRQQAEAFVQLCDASGYCDAKMVATFRTPVPPPPHHPDATEFAQLTDPTTRLRCLMRLFFLGLPVEQQRVHQLLPQAVVESCLESGMLADDQGRYRPTMLIIPCERWLFAADLHPDLASGQRRQEDDQYVTAPSQASLELLRFAIRQPVGKMLDLCGGIGLYAVVASEFSQQVISSDLNPRARLYTEFNAALNGCTNLRAVTGDLLQAVVGEKFDFVLCNPPFVISPAESSSFRENPLDLDDFLRHLFDVAPQHLEEGGFFQTIGEWVEQEGEDWQDRLRHWVQHSGCDVWVVQANRELPESYASRRIPETICDPQEQASAATIWHQYFRDRKVAAICGGLFVFRRRSGDNWFDVTELRQPVSGPVGESIAQGFRCRDFLLAKESDHDLLSSRPQLAQGIEQEEVTRWDGNRWRIESILLRLQTGLPVTVGIDQHVRQLICRLDSTRTVAAAIQEFADELGMSQDAARPQALQMVRELILNGCLILD